MKVRSLLVALLLAGCLTSFYLLGLLLLPFGVALLRPRRS